MIVGDDATEEEDALHVFLLMGKEYRISRSIRAQWFFQQFNSTLPCPKPQKELIDSNEELEVLSVISNNLDSAGPYRLVPSTHITFIGRQYRFVFCIDISPSLATVDIQSGTVITDEAFEKFKNCLCGLVTPFSVPGNNIVLSPELYITVLAYTSILNPEAPQVLIQGCLVTEQNVNTVLELVHNQLTELEDFLAKTTCTLYCNAGDKINRTESDQGGMTRDPVTLMSPEAGPVSILRNCLLALQLLPSNASAGAVVITDGVFALPDASAVDSILAQLRASTVCCSFIKVGSGFHAHCSLGYVPHCDMMQFIAMASSGAYLAKAPPISREGRRADGGDDYTMNLYHKSLLCWNFQRDFDLSKIDSWIVDCLELSVSL